MTRAQKRVLDAALQWARAHRRVRAIVDAGLSPSGFARWRNADRRRDDLRVLLLGSAVSLLAETERAKKTGKKR